VNQDAWRAGAREDGLAGQRSASMITSMTAIGKTRNDIISFQTFPRNKILPNIAFAGAGPARGGHRRSGFANGPQAWKHPETI
jgi:hypothetical protein